jgi:hypothetical protein
VTSPKKRQRTGVAASNSPPKPVAHDSDSETSDSDDDWDASGKKKKPKKKKAKLSTGKHNRKPSSDNESHSDPEEGGKMRIICINDSFVLNSFIFQN